MVDNVYSNLSYSSAQLPQPPDDLYPPPQIDFAVGDFLALNTYAMVLHHDVTGIKVIFVLFPRSGGVWPEDALFVGQYDNPDWYSEPGYRWLWGVHFEEILNSDLLKDDWW